MVGGDQLAHPSCSRHFAAGWPRIFCFLLRGIATPQYLGPGKQYVYCDGIFFLQHFSAPAIPHWLMDVCLLRVVTLPTTWDMPML